MSATWLRVVALAGLFLAPPLPAQQPVIDETEDVEPPRRVGVGDWPGWRGLPRDGLSRERGLLHEWPKGGPPLLWKIKGLGEGYSTPAILGGKLYVLGTDGDRNESLLCLDAKTGKQLWAAEVAPEAKIATQPGPRSTPFVSNGRVHVLSSGGRLVCVRASSGEVLWKKDLVSDYGGKRGPWGYAESPLVDGGVVVCTPGGTKATMLALKASDGAEVWKAAITGLKAKKGVYETAAYSSTIVASVGGVRQYIQFLAGGVVAVGAKDGKLLWHYDEPAAPTANCATPIFRDGAVFAASAYGIGGGKAVISNLNGAFKAEHKFLVGKLQNHHGNLVLVGDHLFGTGAKSLMCVSFKDGTVAWDEPGAGKGSVTYADDHIYHRGERGEMKLVEANPAGYREKGRFTQPERSGKNTWAHPVIAGGRLYLRDADLLFCYDIKAKGN